MLEIDTEIAQATSMPPIIDKDVNKTILYRLEKNQNIDDKLNMKESYNLLNISR